MFFDRDDDWMDFERFSYSKQGEKYAEMDIVSFHATLTVSMFKLYGISEVDLITNDDHEMTVDYESCWSSELSCSEKNKRFVPECEPGLHPEH